MEADKPRRPDGEPIGSDLARFDAMRDEDIDTEDAPVPDLASWVRNARRYDPLRRTQPLSAHAMAVQQLWRAASEYMEASPEDTRAAVSRVLASQAGVLKILEKE